MNPTFRYLLILGATITGIAALKFGLFPLLPALCGNEPVATEQSPDSQLKIVVFERDCGATTDFTTQVSLLNRTSELVNTPGNIFIADTDRGRAPSGPKGGPRVTVHWVTNDSVEIQFDRRARVVRLVHTQGRVRIAYSHFQRDGA